MLRLIQGEIYADQGFSGLSLSFLLFSCGRDPSSTSKEIETNESRDWYSIDFTTFENPQAWEQLYKRINQPVTSAGKIFKLVNPSGVEGMNLRCQSASSDGLGFCRVTLYKKDPTYSFVKHEDFDLVSLNLGSVHGLSKGEIDNIFGKENLELKIYRDSRQEEYDELVFSHELNTLFVEIKIRHRFDKVD